MRSAHSRQLLSDVFENKKVKADVELNVRMLNINYGHNKLLMDQCKVLEEYSMLVAVIRNYIKRDFVRKPGGGVGNAAGRV